MDTFKITHLNRKEKIIHFETHQPTNMFGTMMRNCKFGFRVRGGAIQLLGTRELPSAMRKIARRFNARMRELRRFAPCQLVENEYEL